MTMEYTYIIIGVAAALSLALTTWVVARRNRKHDNVDMPKQDGDPLLEAKTPAANAGRWGDQVVGAPRVISAESIEERISRIHERAHEYQAQHARPKLYANSVHTHPLSNNSPAKHAITQQHKNTNKPSVSVLYVMAPTGYTFAGRELYQALINVGLIHGKMNIFHYHLHEDKRQAVLFSVASAVNPGVIDIDNIDHFSTPGLTLFINTTHRAHQHAAHEAIIAVAEQLAGELGGIVLDENRQPWAVEETSA